ncbi:hypothetical protein HDU82_006315 [Entophlyctis luteolus]|nr:hypothetical protein HDU82_006315 [Entophlyctis luteolus]
MTISSSLLKNRRFLIFALSSCFALTCYVVSELLLDTEANISFLESDFNATRIKKIAFCSSGDAGTFNLPEVYESQKANLFDLWDGDIFLVLKHDVMGRESLHQNIIDYADAVRLIQPVKTLWTENTSLNDWEICWQLIRKREEMLGGEYKYVVKLRPDLIIAAPMPPAELLEHDDVLMNPRYEDIPEYPLTYYDVNGEFLTDTEEYNLVTEGVSDIFLTIQRKYFDPMALFLIDSAKSFRPSSVAPQKIAVCSVGESRTFHYPEVYLSQKRNLFDAWKTDLFFVSSVINRPVHNVEVPHVPVAEYDKVLRILKPINALWRNETPSFYYDWRLCGEMITRHEMRTNTTYDLVVKMRPDLMIAKKMPPIDRIPLNEVLMNPYYEFLNRLPLYDDKIGSDFFAVATGAPERDYGVSDIFLTIPRKYFDIIAHDIGNMDVSLPLSVCGQRSNDPECRPKASMKFRRIPYRPYPFLVKIRRHHEFCLSSDWNRFNSWC